MLAMVGYPIAMSDATPDILRQFPNTTGSVEAVIREMLK
jgi:hydroxymethylpyrimidine pyrophosphatase-like HAD family hydrolase